MNDKIIMLNEFEANAILRMLGNNIDDLTEMYNSINNQI